MSTKPATRQIPTRPIEKAHITFPADHAAGLHAQSFTAEVWIDPDTVDGASFWGWLSIIRKKLADTYSEMCGDGRPSVTFDFEVAEWNTRESKPESAGPVTLDELVANVTTAQKNAHSKPLQLD